MSAVDNDLGSNSSSGSSSATCDINVRLISRDRFKVTKMDRSHAFVQLGSLPDRISIQDKEARAVRLLKDIEREKLEVKEAAKELFTIQIIKLAQAKCMTYMTGGFVLPVASLKDLASSWSQDCSNLNAERLWYVLYGQFEVTVYWRQDIERQIMSQFHWEYQSRPGESELNRTSGGCVGKMVTQAKTEIIKNVNRLGKSVHGKRVGVSNKKNEGRKQGRRKMGQFDISFVQSTGTGTATDTCTGSAGMAPMLPERVSNDTPVATTMVSENMR